MVVVTVLEIVGRMKMMRRRKPKTQRQKRMIRTSQQVHSRAGRCPSRHWTGRGQMCRLAPGQRRKQVPAARRGPCLNPSRSPQLTVLRLKPISPSPASAIAISTAAIAVYISASDLAEKNATAIEAPLARLRVAPVESCGVIADGIEMQVAVEARVAIQLA
jgi:hypothetical protein